MKILFFFLLFYNSLLISADLNVDLVEAQTQKYTMLLKKISSNSKPNDEQILQKTLLLKLIDFSSQKPYKSETLQIATNQYTYTKLFKIYVEKLFTLSKIKKTLHSDKEKIKTLQAQISMQDTEVLTTQLFYAFYKKESKKYEEQLLIIQKDLQNIQNILITTLKKIPCT